MVEDTGQPSNFAEPTGNTSNIDVDSLMNQIESPGPTMTQEVQPGTPQAPAPTAPQAPQPQPGEFEITWKGQQIKTTWDKAKQWASQGYDYAQRTQALNIERQRFENDRTEFKSLQDRYNEVDQYAKENPDWWNHVQSSYLQARQQLDPTSQVPPQILEKLNKYDQFIQNLEQEKQTQQITQEDSALGQQIQSVQEQFKDLDWKTPDAEGKTLEFKVLDYGIKRGIRTFDDAFKSFYHSDLIKLAEERAKEAVNKDVQKRTKLGVLGTSPTPQNGFKPASNIKEQTYDDILREVKLEYGIT